MSNALSYTLPDFDIHLIYNYRLSWAELSLLTNIAINYQSIDPNKSILYFSKILEYCGLNSFDICFTANSYHVPVFEEIDAFSKLSIESQFQQLSPGGAISYVETPNLQNNIEAVLQIIRFILRKIF